MKWFVMARLLAGFFIAVSAVAAGAQSVPNHSVPVGRGPGTGFRYVGPCALGEAITGTGTSTDPTCQTPAPGAPGAAPTLSSCGTSPTVIGSNAGGLITTGSSARGCTVSFNADRPYTLTPLCTVAPQTTLSWFSYTVTTSAITIATTQVTSAKINFICVRRAGG